MRHPDCLGLFYFLALLYGVLASPLVWINPSERLHLHYNLIRLKQYLGEAIDDIEQAWNGQNPNLRSHLVSLLGDDSSTLQKTSRVKQHIQRGKSVLSKGYSQDDLYKWLDSGKANGAVSIFSDRQHLPEHPQDRAYVYSVVSGVVYPKTDIAWTMLDPYAETKTWGLVCPDADRLPNYANRGEALHISPKIIAKSKAEGDKLANDAWYQIVTTPARYTQYGAEPAGESPQNTKLTPVDLIILGLQNTMLHELFHTVPFGQLLHGPGASAGWKDVVLGRTPLGVPKEDHPEIISIVVALTRILRKGYWVDIQRGTVHAS